MPLPPALLARLKKRGIIKDPGEEDSHPATSEVEEEVIAEDYDDKDIPLPPGVPGEDDDQDLDNNNNDPKSNKLTLPTIAAAPGCPNKWNIYHECSTYCHSHWGSGRLRPSPRIEKLRNRMLRKYPLPDGWKELYDPGTGRHYYWKIATDEVCWLSPNHPKAKVSIPAEKLRAIMKEAENEKEKEEVSDDEEMEKSASESDVSDEDTGAKDIDGAAMDFDGVQMDSDSEDSEDEEDRKKSDDDSRDKHYRPRHEERVDKRGRVRAKNNQLDPMDPAAYSDTPRGTWSTGLDRRGEGKTDIDTTANGPLYQMRPYPNPGAVLRMNEAEKEKDKRRNST